MPDNKCKAVKSDGSRCNLRSGASGYCHIHDPDKIAKRKQMQKEIEEERQHKSTRSKRYEEVIEVVRRICEVKGWYYNVKNDRKNWRYASVNVEKEIPSDYTTKTITGVLDITVDNGVKIRRNSTSFYSYGLEALQEAIMNEIKYLPWLKPAKVKQQADLPSTWQKLEQLLLRFPMVARQLRRRHDNRETLVIKDEYDVQDFLHALLRISFDDVRPEEYTPSYAGVTSRMDFLLKGEKTVVEVKMASNKLKDRGISDELIIDISRYQTHPDCNTLVCFIYDPDAHLRNPSALESDLGGKHNDLEVRVIVAPKV